MIALKVVNVSRFPEEKVRAVGRSSTGVRGVRFI